VNFESEVELRTFRESMRTAIGDWRGPLEPSLGSWVDDRDDDLAERVAAAGWIQLWLDPQLDVAVAGGLELGRAVAPLCALDEATLGAPLAVGDRVRHGQRADSCALALPGCGLALARPARDRRPEVTLDGSGTVRAKIEPAERLHPLDARVRLRLWSAASLGYFAGLGEAVVSESVAYTRGREQFGRPLSSLPIVQARLADSALAVDGLLLTAWASAADDEDPPLRPSALLWAGRTCREVTATAQQLHGAIGFALESGLHRYHRRAKSAQVWSAELCRVATSGDAPG